MLTIGFWVAECIPLVECHLMTSTARLKNNRNYIINRVRAITGKCFGSWLTKWIPFEGHLTPTAYFKRNRNSIINQVPSLERKYCYLSVSDWPIPFEGHLTTWIQLVSTACFKSNQVHHQPSTCSFRGKMLLTFDFWLAKWIPFSGHPIARLQRVSKIIEMTSSTDPSAIRRIIAVASKRRTIKSTRLYNDKNIP